MKEIKGDIWSFHKDNNWVVIPTNGNVTKLTEAVMGKGLALQAKKKFPELPRELGEKLAYYGNTVNIFPKYRLITVPTKQDFKEDSTLDLLTKSLNELKICLDFLFMENFSSTIAECLFDKNGDVIIEQVKKVNAVYIPQLGCGAGHLNWKDVKKLITKTLKDDRIVLVSKEIG